TENRQRLRQRRKLVERGTQLSRDVRGIRRTTQKLLALGEMTLAQLLDSPKRADQMSFRGLLANRDEGIRRASESGNDHRRLAIDPSEDDLSGALDRVGVLHRRPPEFYDY